MTTPEKGVAGRPREHDRDKIADELVEWAQLDSSTNLNGFCATRFLAPSKITLWAKECDRFRQAYEIAKTAVGLRREQKLSDGTLHVKAYDLNAAVYDYFLKEERREQAKFESTLNQTTPDTLAINGKIDAVMDMIDKGQRASSARRIDESNNKAEANP